MDTIKSGMEEDRKDAVVATDGKNVIVKQPTQPVPLTTCPHCNKSLIPTGRGVRNWKNLFKKPSLSDWITLFLLVLVLLACWAYARDTQVCRNTLENFDTMCVTYVQSVMDSRNNANNHTIAPINFSTLYHEVVVNKRNTSDILNNVSTT